MGFEMEKGESTPSRDETAELKERRDAIMERLDGLRQALKDGDKKFEGKVLTEVERKIRSKAIAEIQSDIQNAEKMLVLLNDMIAQTQSYPDYRETVLVDSDSKGKDLKGASSN